MFFNGFNGEVGFECVRKQVEIAMVFTKPAHDLYGIGVKKVFAAGQCNSSGFGNAFAVHDLFDLIEGEIIDRTFGPYHAMLTGGVAKVSAKKRQGRKSFFPGEESVMNEIVGPVIVIAFFVHRYVMVVAKIREREKLRATGCELRAYI